MWDFSETPFDSISHERPDYFGLLEFATERVRSRKNGYKERWKSFTHFKREILPHPVANRCPRDVSLSRPAPSGPFAILDQVVTLNGLEYDDPERLYGEFDFDDTSGPILFDTSDADNYFVEPPMDLELLLVRAYRNMLPIIKSELSLINSVIELKDFVSLPRTILGLGRLGLSVYRRSSQTIRELLHASADSYLQAEFNVLPLLSDIAGIHRAISSVAKRIPRFLAEEGKVVKRHFAVPLTEFENPEPREILRSLNWYLSPFGTDFEDHFAWDGHIIWNRTIEYLPSMFHAEIMYNANYTYLQREFARELGTLDALGVQLNPEIIWNAVPWTFVCDWIVQVARFLEKMKTPNMNPQINIVNALWSIKRTKVHRFERHYVSERNYHFDLDATTELPPYEVRETLYQRNVSLPGVGLLETSGLSLNEFSLGAALAISRIKRRKRGKSPLVRKFLRSALHLKNKSMHAK